MSCIDKILQRLSHSLAPFASLPRRKILSSGLIPTASMMRNPQVAVLGAPENARFPQVFRKLRRAQFPGSASGTRSPFFPRRFYGPRVGRLLDVGCGTGNFPSAGSAAAQFASKFRQRNRVFPLLLQQFRIHYPDEQFDVVTGLRCWSTKRGVRGAERPQSRAVAHLAGRSGRPTLEPGVTASHAEGAWEWRASFGVQCVDSRNVEAT